jgi:hypothetical protein
MKWFFIPPISFSNESRALQHLSAYMSVQMYQYQTTLAEDEALAAAVIAQDKTRHKTKGGPPTPPLYSNQAQALFYMLGEKRVCDYYQRLAHVVAPLFQEPIDRQAIERFCHERQPRHSPLALDEDDDDEEEEDEGWLPYVEDVVAYLCEPSEAARPTR